jgi:four helix bundle protein
MGDTQFFESLQNKMDMYVHFVYGLTKKYPKDELYGTTSQLRRSTLSIVLNYIEGFARFKPAVKANFWEISYGSLKESKYLVNFSFKENYITEQEYEQATTMAEEIGAMLWSCMKSVVR